MREFHLELDVLVQEFGEVAGLVVGVVNRLADDPGTASPALIAQVDAADSEVRERLRSLEGRGHVLLARQAPVGSDLRRLVAILRLIANIERTSRHARHVMESCRSIEVLSLPPEIRRLLESLARRAAEVLQGGLEAWTAGDALAVIDLEGPERDVDDLQLRLLQAASHSPEVHGETRLALGLTARHYERIADYGMSLARDAAFVVTGLRLGDAPLTPQPGSGHRSAES